MYESSLTSNSPTYWLYVCEAPHYHYEAIEVNVVLSGLYSFSFHSRINIYANIYTNKFNPISPSENFLAENEDGCSGFQFKFICAFHANITYVLVVTTCSSNVTGNFSIIASGPNNVSFNRISEYLHYYMNIRHRNSKSREKRRISDSRDSLDSHQIPIGFLGFPSDFRNSQRFRFPRIRRFPLFIEARDRIGTATFFNRFC
jgi:hypothetical protein